MQEYIRGPKSEALDSDGGNRNNASDLLELPDSSFDPLASWKCLVEMGPFRQTGAHHRKYSNLDTMPVH